MENNLIKIGSDILSFIGDRVPGIELNIEVENASIKLLIEASAIYIYPNNKSIVINGKLAEIAYALSQRLDIHFIHWNSFTNTTFLNCAKTRPNFIEKVELLIILLLVFPDIDLQKFFKDKIALATLKRKDYTSKMYITTQLGLILLYIKDNGPISIQIKDVLNIDKMISSHEAESFLKNVCDTKLKETENENSSIKK